MKHTLICILCGEFTCAAFEWKQNLFITQCQLTDEPFQQLYISLFQ